MFIPSRYIQSEAFSNGGMSDAGVYEDTHLERKVVIKSLKDGVDPKRILDEIASLQVIRSKHVVELYDVIVDKHGRVAAIVEEYLPGDDLTQAPLPANADEFLRLVYPVARGIADIHEHDRIHRDIKRQNMKFDAERCLKIFDFGLARDERHDASTIGIKGTPGYMAPELFIPDRFGQVSFTKAVDTFAFGATALALALGQLPRPLRHTPPKIPDPTVTFTALPFVLSADIVDLLNRCLAEKAHDRPSMSDVAEEIARQLLRDKHRAVVTAGGQTFTLNATKRVVRLRVEKQGSLVLNYDGLRFFITEVAGSVAVNNMPAQEAMEIPGSCVIVLGAPELGAARTNITVDVAHPEVNL